LVQLPLGYEVRLFFQDTVRDSAKALSVSTEEFVSSEPELEEGKRMTVGKKDPKRKRGSGTRRPGSSRHIPTRYNND
jgi:hypothetical protein